MKHAPLTTPAASVVAFATDSDRIVHPAHPPVSNPSSATTTDAAAPDMPVTRLAAVEAALVSPAVPTPYFRVKTIVELVMTMLLMSVAIPIMAFVAIAILVCDGRPIFYRQVRVGKNGKNFRIWKFRTMKTGAEKHTGPVWSSPNDSRVTRLGRWLRCCHLDELPQFINVLAGDMSLVGPRPERPEFVRTLSEEVPGYLQRTRVRPGITGLAQLKLGYDESIVGIPQKVACDLHYICTASLVEDLKLLLSTLPYIAGQLCFKLRAKPKSHPQRETAAVDVTRSGDVESEEATVIELTQNVA
ncbi:UDP-N-acetylgalactosamine-undecaprenyl-phosphate N-acetylgalactosaminephosphotransferase [Stieleria maiorica]|uniref:UDP-N-acetylgalactosamine-undecaprenyl-phosphate N-acetylgalactosaminephosphotransferase n=1 Tax=Stieleria maiorica TaxID=2795974 RepID=A0A5B9MQP9_9BACT|nr:sugar transferase [Stieleria maiorica]QEG02185.1 UDP-N-acetylgalactosamine-undecaprenyl-phosphate N-acetylgalactosaminephosphotransferase [Stieleria maiorica]